MAIQSDDIKLLKSAVMADVPEGGGGATGIEIADGVSNNIFNDISTDDRAQGAFHLRKLFGMAHTDNTDTLLGAGFSVMAPPQDDKVSVLLFETPGWFDERTDAVALVERYLVKGPRLVSRVADVHYSGTSLLQLYNPAPGEGFPQPGDAIVLRNPNGGEQYVRVLKTTRSEAVVTTDQSGAYTVNLCTCQLNKPLTFDLLGAPITRISPGSNAAWVYSTTPSVGAVFYGVKPLGSAASIGDRSVTVDGGIMASLVPASTVPEPVIDQYPLVQRPSLSRTAAGAWTVPPQSLTLSPGTVLQLPTAVEPGSLTMTHGTTAFTSDGQGNLMQGSLVVGSVDHAGRTLTMSGTAPNYGTASNSISAKAATRSGASAHSIAIPVTSANQSSALVFSLEPTPAPGTISLAYMFQGVWYELLEDGSGRLSGSDSDYGSGQLNFATGSLAASLGALPDVGSAVVITWGEAASAEAASGLPARAWTDLPVDQQPDGTIEVSWSRGVTNYTATVAADGTVTGPAQARPLQRQSDGSYLLPFSPDTLPSGDISLSYTPLADTSSFVNNGGGSYTLTGAPIKPGSVRFRAIGTSSADGWQGGPAVYNCYSKGTEVYAYGVGVIGTINNTTGAMVLSHSGISITGYSAEKRKYIIAG